MNKTKKNDSGMSLIEVMVGFAVLGIIITIVTSGLGTWFGTLNKVKTTEQGNEMVTSIMESLVHNSRYYQANFAGPDSLPEFDPNNLPMAWSKTGINVPVEQCPKCNGRYGIRMWALEDYRGLYMMEITMTHPTIKGNKVYSRIVGF